MTTRVTFRATDLTRAAKAAQAAGLTVVRTEILPDGRILLIHSDGQDADAGASPYDAWRKKRGQNQS